MARKPVTPQQMVRATAPALLMRTLADLDELDAHMRMLSRDMRLAGMTWADIARVHGTSRQAARERFAPLVADWEAEHGTTVKPWDLDLGYAGAMASDVQDEVDRLQEMGELTCPE